MPQKPLQDVQEEPTADVVVAGWKIGGMEGREVLKDGKKAFVLEKMSRLAFKLSREMEVVL